MPIRIFLVDKAGKIRRFPSSRFARLYERNGSESLPEHAGEWVHFAEMIVHLENRRPVRILRACYIRMKMGPNGKPDPRGIDDLFRLAAESIEPGFEPEAEVIRGGPYWARKRLDDRHRWTPTAFQEKAIRRLALER